MNKLPRDKRIQILDLLVEGASMRATSRVVGVSINTVTKLLVDAGAACAEYHDMVIRDVQARYIQCDEIWAFCYAKQKNAARATGVVDQAGDAWTWTAIDADTKLVVSWLVGGRDSGYALEFMDDLRARVANRVQLSTDGHNAYLVAIEDAFGADVDYAQLVKLYGPVDSESERRRYSPGRCVGLRKTAVSGRPDMDEVSTSYVERHNLTMRMHMRRFTRLTNAFSKKMANYAHSVALYTVWYNFCRVHSTLKATPAMVAGIAESAHDLGWLIDLIDRRAN